jgi:hypothetical protein
MKYGISSYHRPACKTYKTLIEMGANPQDITICVNDKKDYEEYTQLYPNVEYVEGNCVAINRNHLLDISDGQIVLFDDDIRSFKKLVAKQTKSGVGWQKIQTIGELELFIDECFDAMKETGAVTFGVYSMENAEWALESLLRDGKYSCNKLYQGGFCGFKSPFTKYDDSFRVLDDYELIVRLISKGGLSLRRNDLIASKNGMGNDEGGYYNLYKQGIQEFYGAKLVRKYPRIIKANKDYSRFILR